MELEKVKKIMEAEPIVIEGSGRFFDENDTLEVSESIEPETAAAVVEVENKVVTKINDGQQN
jgi:hypothetical protein